MQPITCSVDDAAKAIGIGRVTLYKYINQGMIESIRVGNRRLINIASLRQFAGVDK